MFRLRTLSSTLQPVLSTRQPTSTGFALGGSLPACIAEDREIVEALRPLIDAYEQELRAWRGLDPHVVIVEVIWSASHTEKEISTAEITKASSQDFAKQILGFVFHRSIRYNCYTHAISLR